MFDVTTIEPHGEGPQPPFLRQILRHPRTEFSQSAGEIANQGSKKVLPRLGSRVSVAVPSTTGSQIAWNAQATLGVNFTRNIFAEPGYRYMYVDYDKNHFLYQMNSFGLN
jgi:hypothetical protein